jgi:ketosteroid isomerase-like protein
MAQQDVERMRASYEAFNRGDVPGAQAAYDDRIEWSEPGGGRAPRGTFRGVEQVGREVFALVARHFDEFGVEPERFIDAGEQVVVIGRFRGRSKGGRELEAPFVHVWTMRDVKAARLTNYVEAEPWAAAWSG